MRAPDILKGAASAAVSAAVAYIALHWGAVTLDEPWKSVITLIALAVWNRYRPGKALVETLNRVVGR